MFVSCAISGSPWRWRWGSVTQRNRGVLSGERARPAAAPAVVLRSRGATAISLEKGRGEQVRMLMRRRQLLGPAIHPPLRLTHSPSHPPPPHPPTSPLPPSSARAAHPAACPEAESKAPGLESCSLGIILFSNLT